MSETLTKDPRMARVDVIGVPITATNMVDFMGLLSERLDDMRVECPCLRDGS